MIKWLMCNHATVCVSFSPLLFVGATIIRFNPNEINFQYTLGFDLKEMAWQLVTNVVSNAHGFLHFLLSLSLYDSLLLRPFIINLFINFYERIFQQTSLLLGKFCIIAGIFFFSNTNWTISLHSKFSEFWSTPKLGSCIIHIGYLAKILFATCTSACIYYIT